MQTIAETWAPLFFLHLLEVSLFTILVWILDRSLRMPTRVRYLLWVLALAKTFIPPIVAVPNLIRDTIPYSELTGGPQSPVWVGDGPVHSLAEPLVLSAWIVWVVLLSSAVLWRNLHLRHQLYSGGVTSIRSTLIRRLLVGCQVDVFTTSAVQSPLLVGLLYPRLYLPDSWETWPEEHTRVIISHEANHIQNRDQFVLLLQTISVILFGLNPFVWLIHRRLTYLRELRCDEAAILETGVHPVHYSELLYQFVEGRPLRPIPVLTGTFFSENPRAVLKRFGSILRLPERDALRSKLWHHATLALLSLAILPLSMGDSLSFLDLVPAKPDLTPTRNRWQRILPPLTETWLDEPLPFYTVEEKPVLLEAPSPAYPMAAQMAGLEGHVFLSFDVDTTGSVSAVKVLEGSSIFTQSAVDAASRFLFRPARHGGRLVASRVTMPISFKLTR